ncbi:response regulator [Massilia sp. R2A-15]|uniref:response regulator n=1 Tax=Massilia sp. R2A-15 TaxID=3064278 RepID=UPI0027366537|nr:response regulator [Massilia sp. R2A-15]WLI87687.1 response regulator [Massilia sp. R2A-15]
MSYEFDGGAPARRVVQNIPAGALAQAALRVLVVDRNPEMLDLLGTLLEHHGCAVACAASADQALALAPEFQPHAVCSGLVLGGVDGFTLASRLRALPETAASLLIAVSGRHHPDDKASARAAGFDHFVVKPFILDEVVAPLLALRQTLNLSA